MPLDEDLTVNSILNPCSGNSHFSTSLPPSRLDAFTKVSGFGHEGLGRASMGKGTHLHTRAKERTAPSVRRGGYPSKSALQPFTQCPSTIRCAETCFLTVVKISYAFFRLCPGTRSHTPAHTNEPTYRHARATMAAGEPLRIAQRGYVTARLLPPFGN